MQIILQEFAQYGEKYTVMKVDSTDLDSQKLQKNELVIVDYLNNNPDAEINIIHDNLKEKLLNGTQDSVRQLTFAQFRKLLSTMLENGVLSKKAIEVPLEFRLMIRNIVAMKNLAKKWI